MSLEQNNNNPGDRHALYEQLARPYGRRDRQQLVAEYGALLDEGMVTFETYDSTFSDISTMTPLDPSTEEWRRLADWLIDNGHVGFEARRRAETGWVDNCPSWCTMTNHDASSIVLPGDAGEHYAMDWSRQSPGWPDESLYVSVGVTYLEEESRAPMIHVGVGDDTAHLDAARAREFAAQILNAADVMDAIAGSEVPA